MLTRTARCPVCDAIFSYERATRKTCSDKCRQRLKRFRATCQCWQSRIRERNLETDLAYAGLSLEEARGLSPRDFALAHVPATDLETCRLIDWFIRRNEWMRTAGNGISHRFVATFRGVLAGVVLIGAPNFPSKLLDAPERLIQRGACISWSPKGLASRLLMHSLRWMVQNSEYRIFTAYSDPEANEVGTIYQACNFRYLGQSYGTRRRYQIAGKEHSDRYFRSRKSYRDYAEALGLPWRSEWDDGNRIAWELIPNEVEVQIRAYERRFRGSCQGRPVALKGKYALIVGKDRKETRRLNAEFEKLHPELVGLSYPKR